MINYVKRSDIDDLKWNTLIAKHPSGLPYAFTWYLDAVLDDWRAFVLNDYEAVMPLPIAKKLGFSYVYQHSYIQQLGVFASEKNAAVTNDFFRELNKRFLRYHVAQNTFCATIKGFSKRVNIELELNHPLSEITEHYSENTKRNIAKAEKKKMQFSSKINADEFSRFVAQNAAFDFPDFSRLLLALQQHNMLFLCGVCDESHSLQAVDLCVKTHNRIVNLIPVTGQEGRKNGAMHFLLHNVIAKHSEQNFTLDFEGSSVPSIARFYRSFGAREVFFYEKKRLVR